MAIVNNDYIEVNGPNSLAELLTTLDPSGASQIRPGGDLAILEFNDDVYALIQYDAVDADTWPYMITVQARNGDPTPVRLAAQRLTELVRTAGWTFRMTSDADDILIEPTVAVTAR
ncbi:hypothetical protein [Arthrobacter sp. SLBN-53]|uniref:hypothetical protein n=1 Tax=Arthrobacter sp. SLBN-53 TaxID=2768412 RepID=UPI00114EE2F0|nr:hypothetical protein [Arthrobacter sp. SLBN-53]TQK29387.1 hypothetical protein FBY28_2390 [Arthrobacter sp. SLBN-53]